MNSRTFTCNTSRTAVVRLTLGLVLAGIVVGCATSDMITFSKDSQRKGVTLYNEGSYAEAAGAFRNASRQNPRDYRNYYYLGASYEQMGKYQQAISSYRTARATLNRSINPHDDEFRMRIINGLGRAIARSNQNANEIDAVLHEAEQTSDGESWFILAKIYSFLGDADGALDAYNRAALLQPKNFLIQKDYGLYLEQIGQTDRAQAPLRQAYALRGDDEQVTTALRRIGIVPGPSLKPQSALVKPPLPKGPIPELELNLDFLKGGSASTSAPPPPSVGQSTVEAPRD